MKHDVEEMPQVMDMWNQISMKKEVSMYFAKANLNRKNGLSEWEVKFCPWWIDFKEGECPPSEKTQYQLHEKGCLVVDDDDDASATEMALRSFLTAAPEKPQVVEKKSKKKVDDAMQPIDDTMPYTPAKRRHE
ncbi:hypothetical protein O6H91_Y175100 [Diphasiastrum complanatum]|nr:hypothetical protein O6H91_Y175100 [Diphasiastrum complanatum]